MCVYEQFVDNYQSQDCIVKQERDNYLMWCSYKPSNRDIHKHIRSWRQGTNNKETLKMTSPYWCGRVSFDLKQYDDMTYCNMRVSTIDCILFGTLNAQVLRPFQQVIYLRLEPFPNLHIDMGALQEKPNLHILEILNAHFLTDDSNMSTKIRTYNNSLTSILIAGENLQEKMMPSHNNYYQTGLLCKVVQLAIRGNITHIPDGYFKGCDETEYVDLSFNQMHNLTNRALQGLDGLFTLYLNHNWISYIGPTLFNNTPSLTTLDLSNNKITYLEPYTFIYFYGFSISF